MPETLKQDEYKSLTRQKVLLRIAQHFLFTGPKMFGHLKKHFALMKVLKPFKNAGLISFRTYGIYLFSYISKSLDVNKKVEILTHNYSFLKNIFPQNQLKKLFKEGIEFYNESSGEDIYSVALHYSSILEFEGSLSLFFYVNNCKIFTLSFTFAPGSVFDTSDKTVIYVSCLQGVKNQFETISKTTKHFNDVIPAVILLKVLEAFAVALNIRTVLGISAKHQLSFGNEADYENFYDNYDDFWYNAGGELVNGNFILPCPVPQKSLSLIKQNHRNRTIKKRGKLNEVYVTCYHNVLNILILPLLDNIACNVASSFDIAELSIKSS